MNFNFKFFLILLILIPLSGCGQNIFGPETPPSILTSDVFLPQYDFTHTNKTILINGSSVWTNVTFTQEVTDIRQGIQHSHDGVNSDKFNITISGIYEIDYDFDVIDLSGASSDIDVAGRVIFSNGTEITGSVFETDITKKDIEVELSHDFLARFSAGDQIIFQFIGDDPDIQISTHGTFGVHPESATIVINKIANLKNS